MFLQLSFAQNKNINGIATHMTFKQRTLEKKTYVAY